MMRGDTFHFGPMSGLLVARITQHHAVIIERVQVLHPSLRRRLTRRALGALRGARVSTVERRGKHQLVHLEDGRVVHVHFRMNGDWIIGASSDPLPRFARAVFEFASGTRVRTRAFA